MRDEFTHVELSDFQKEVVTLVSAALMAASVVLLLGLDFVPVDLVDQLWVAIVGLGGGSLIAL